VARWNQDFARNGLVPLEWDLTGTGYEERCCFCNMPTRCGIYVRLDPATVPYPQKEERDE